MMLTRRCSLRLPTASVFIGLVLSTWAHPRATYAQSMTIDFDNVTAPCAFTETEPLTAQYATQGVTFSGPDAQSGGAILNECSGFPVTRYIAPNFLAFNTTVAYPPSGIAHGPETVTF